MWMRLNWYNLALILCAFSLSIQNEELLNDMGSIAQYSGDLNIRIAWFPIGTGVSSCRLVQISNVIWIPDTNFTRTIHDTRIKHFNSSSFLSHLGNKSSRDPIPDREPWSLSSTTTEDRLRHANGPIHISIPLHLYVFIRSKQVLFQNTLKKIKV